jgi:hypothetical protein
VPDECRPATRRLAWLEASVLIVYGGVLTSTGLALQIGLIKPGNDADWKALDWHAYLWDPWFLAAGVFVLAALRASGGAPVARRQRARDPSSHTASVP